MPGLREDDGYDDQDNAETFDEANLDDREQIGEMRTFEEMPDLFDATRAYGDRDDDEGRSLDAADFDENEFDDDSLEEDDELDYRASADDFDEDDDEFDDDEVEPDSIEGLDEVADADLVAGGEDDFTNFQSKALSDEDLRRMGYVAGPDPRAERALEIGLEDTFPASDPVSVTRPRR
ncbi:MAG: hypothetical protein C0481_21465 [Phenylobacterium sp.]|uniref:hypothetical protein n=1 Tax=Phenylobacterium sp. TaxID=1871053 RepID=UPI0025E1F247|nr:hypothetical protein [Phenylobacterium sp.]MBA4014433.1 hypothetical protein [Phenylobacterium sp.]